MFHTWFLRRYGAVPYVWCSFLTKEVDESPYILYTSSFFAEAFPRLRLLTGQLGKGLSRMCSAAIARQTQTRYGSFTVLKLVPL